MPSTVSLARACEAQASVRLSTTCRTPVWVRVEREGDGTLSVHEASAFTGLYAFVKRGSAEEIVTHYDVSGTMRKLFGE